MLYCIILFNFSVLLVLLDRGFCSKTPHHNMDTLAKVSNQCVKTNFRSKNSKAVHICSAYSDVSRLFEELLVSEFEPLSAIFGSVVRLTFHDAGEVDVRDLGDMNGPDGCLSQDGSSDGLTEPDSIVVKYLEPIWQEVCDRISRADFWALLGKIVLEKSIHPPIIVPYQFGRKDNIECEGGARRLPDATGNLSEVKRVFVHQMGLTMNDAGAHSLGHTHIQASGFGIHDPSERDQNLVNAWDNTPDVLDNDFYVKLLTLGWKAHPTLDGDKIQWHHSRDPFIMLSTDMALVYPLHTDVNVHTQTDHSDEQQGCHMRKKAKLPKCKNPLSYAVPSTFKLSRRFADDNNAFQLAFIDAYTKMSTVGYGIPRSENGATATGKLGTLTFIDLTKCSTDAMI